VIHKAICGVQINTLEKWDELLWVDEEILGKRWIGPIRPGDVAIDAGFGPGAWTLTALAKGATVFAFDPKPHAVQILSEILAINDFPGHCCISPIALRDRAGKIFYEGLWFRAITIDEFSNGIKLKQLDHVNMDVEGSELEVIRGGRETIKKFHPRVVAEVHGSTSWAALEGELRSLGDYIFEQTRDFLIAVPRPEVIYHV